MGAAVLRLVFVFAVVLVGGPAIGQTTYYVNGTCGDDSWTGQRFICEAPDGPKRTIQAAIDATSLGDTVLVADGVYTGPGNVNLRPGEARLTISSVNGPFATILDGQLQNQRAFFLEHTGPAPLFINGFTMRNFRMTDGGGGAIWLLDGNLLLANCRLVDNFAAWYGGAIFSDQGAVQAVNCEFVRNESETEGGAIWTWVFRDADFLPTVANCTFVDNTSLSASSVASRDILICRNSIIRGQGEHLLSKSIDATFSNIEGGQVGEGNIDAPAGFYDPVNFVLRLRRGSPCIDAAENASVPPGFHTDIAGRSRFVDDPGTPDTGRGDVPMVDMGAHEFYDACRVDITGDGQVNTLDFLTYLDLFSAGDPAADFNFDGVVSTLDFLMFLNEFNAGCE